MNPFLMPPDDLVNALRNGTLVAFVGAGLSRPLGLPGWDELIRDVWADTREALDYDEGSRHWMDSQAGADPMWAAEVLVGLSPKQIREAVKKRILTPSARHSLNHAILAASPYVGYITTNYDRIIEDHLNVFSIEEIEPIVPSDTPKLSSSLRQGKFIIKMHGDFEAGDRTIVLSSSDYYTLSRNEGFQRLLSRVFVENSFLVLGYSLRDPDFRHFIMERYYLYQEHVPPIFAVVSRSETSLEEIRHYKDKYNVVILPFDASTGYEAITTLLMSLFCLSQNSDPAIHSGSVSYLLQRALLDGEFDAADGDTDLDLQAGVASELLGFFTHGIDLGQFCDYCQRAGIGLTPAHYLSLGKSHGNKLYPFDKRAELSDDTAVEIIALLKPQLNSFGSEEEKFFITDYRRTTVSTFLPRLHVVLRRADAATYFFEENGAEHFDILKQIYRQEGRWKEWNNILKFWIENVPFSEVLRTKVLVEQLWLAFWTRDVKSFEQIYAVVKPHLQEPIKGEWALRRAYLKREFSKLRGWRLGDDNNHYALSMIGRARASEAMQLTGDEKLAGLAEADLILADAENIARSGQNAVETSVQIYYRALLSLELGEFETAYRQIEEVRRLDEALFKRVPGIAWIRLYEYIEEKSKGKDTNNITKRRKLIVSAFDEMGVRDIATLIDTDYFF